MPSPSPSVARSAPSSRPRPRTSPLTITTDRTTASPGTRSASRWSRRRRYRAPIGPIASRASPFSFLTSARRLAAPPTEERRSALLGPESSPRLRLGGWQGPVRLPGPRILRRRRVLSRLKARVEAGTLRGAVVAMRRDSRQQKRWEVGKKSYTTSHTMKGPKPGDPP